MGQETVIVILAALCAIGLMFIGFVVILYIHRNRRIRHQNEKAILNQEHQQELLSTQLEMQTQTMQQIGREIHDNVGQKLTLASLYIQQLAYENKAPQVKDTIENVSNIINESLHELRQLSKSLTDDRIDNNSIIELLKKECDKVNELKKCAVHFQTSQSQLSVSYQSKSIILRVVQEFLQNSIKHAGCSSITVFLDADPSRLFLNLQDNGSGFDLSSANGKGIGLANMRKRTEMIGGNFLLESSIGKGTALRISIPLLQQ